MANFEYCNKSNLAHKYILVWLLLTKATNTKANDVKDKIRSPYER